MRDVAVLMLTCNRYLATWEPFHHGYCRYWPDRPWHLVVKGGKRGWSDTAIAALLEVGVPIVLLTLDDHWPTGLIDTDALMAFASHIRHGRADHIRLYDSGQPRHGDFEPDPRLFIFARNARYRACLQPSLWSVEALLDLLRPGETAWDFEWHFSSKRTEGSLKYLCVKSNHHFPYALGGEWGRGPVLKGEWTEAARRYAEREGLEIDFSRHPKDGGQG